MNTIFSFRKNRNSCIAGYMAAFFLCLTGFSVSAQTVISGGTRMIVNQGTSVHSSDHFAIRDNGSLNNKGTVILKKNLTNQNSLANSLGSGLVVLSGATGQKISGQNIFQSLTVDNTSGVSIWGHTRINGLLTLGSGRVSLGSYNLVLGPSGLVAEDIGCPGPLCPCPGWNCPFVAATGSGQFRKIFQSAGSFTFPVGDETETAEYSPVTLSFTSGIFGTNNYAGVNLVNNRYPSPGITESYLNRYWNVSQSDISSFSGTATFQYEPQDVVGTESDIWCFRVSPEPFVRYSLTDTALHQIKAQGLTAFGTFTGNKSDVPTPPITQVLQNLTFNSGQIVCYGALQTITVAGNGTNFLVRNGAAVQLVAGLKISMLSGTIAEPGGNLHAYITDGQYCNTVKNTFVAASPGSTEVPAEKPSKSGKIKVYPNPTAGKFTLETEGNCMFPGSSMEIYDSRGEKLMTTILTGERKHEFSLSDHPSGLYFIRVIAGSFAETTKIIKQ